jgi:hypothetical protein
MIAKLQKIIESVLDSTGASNNLAMQDIESLGPMRLRSLVASRPG